jgi:hypothetical protein
MGEYLKKGFLSIFFLVLIIGCSRERAGNTRRTVAMKAFFKTEQFLLRTDSLFPNGLMKHVEIYDEPSSKPEVGYHIADSAKWGEASSDTISSELEVFHGVIFGAETLSTNFMNYEKAKYYFRHPLGLTLFRDHKVDAIFVADGISCRNGELILYHGWSINGPIEMAHPFRFEQFNLTKAISRDNIQR